MREQRRALSLFLVFALLLNLFLPISLVSANADTEEENCTSVSETVYGEEPEPCAEEEPITIPQSMVGLLSAQEITENIITEVKLIDEEGNIIDADANRGNQPTIGSTVILELKYELLDNHGYQAGSTYTFNLPEGFFEIEDFAWDNLAGIPSPGQYKINADGTIILKFNDEIQEDDQYFGASGIVQVWAEFSESLKDGPKDRVIEFPIKDGTKRIPIRIQSTGSTVMVKDGTANKVMNPQSIDWEIVLNKAEETITGAYLEDRLPEGVVLDVGSLKVYKLELRVDGSEVSKELVQASEYDLEFNAEGFKLDFKGDISNAYRVTYTTKITNIETSQTLTNTATLKNGDNDKVDDATKGVEVRFNVPLKKNHTDYDPKLRDISWKIEYNFNQKYIEADVATISDEFDTVKLELQEDSFVVQAVDINDSGQPVNRTPVDETAYAVVPTTEGFELKFNNDVDRQAYEITYKTKIKERVILEDNIDHTQFENSVKVPHVTDWVRISRTVSQQVLFKKHESVNYTDKTMNWEIKLNVDEHPMENITLFDTYGGQGLELDEGSLVITSGSTTLTKGQHFTLDPVSTYSEGFKIQLIGDHANTSATYTINYTTKFDPTIYNSSYKNIAKLGWLTEHGQHNWNKTKEITFKPDNYTQNNGDKTGKYDASTKEITWTIDVNYNLHDIPDPIVRDYYKGNQSFVEGSLEVRELELTGGADGVSTIGAPLVLDTDYTVDYTLVDSEGNNGFELSFSNPIDSAYRITYKTSVVSEDVQKKYFNSAWLYNGTTEISKFLDKEVTIPHAGEYVAKSGEQKGKMVEWLVYINRNQSTVANAKVIDQFQNDNQILVEESFKLYDTTVATNGTVTEKDLLRNGVHYDLTITTDNDGRQSFELAFRDTIHSAYILKYESYINTVAGQEIVNAIAFEGNGQKVERETDKVKIQVRALGGIGTGDVIKGLLDIRKVDADNPELGLEGAEFELYAVGDTGNRFIQSLSTDTAGEVKSRKLVRGDYILQEVTAPDGYLIDDEYKHGKELKVESSTPIILIITNKKLTHAFTLTKIDSADETKRLAGAKFNLEFKNSTGDWELKETITSDENGNITKGNLAAGEYRLTEITPPVGYKLDDHNVPIEFVIEENQTEILKLQANHSEPGKMTNELLPASIVLTKVDHFDGALLAGAEFELQDTEGNVVRNNLTTNQNGQIVIEGLQPETKYYLIETKAPEHYILDQTPIEVEIELGTSENKKELTVTNHLMPGSVKLTKVRTNDPDTKLEGAEFTLQDANGVIVKDNDGNELTGLTTDENGELIVEDLRPGEYQFVETKAPNGYILNSDPIPFTIEKGQASGAHVLVTVENKRRSTGGGGGGNPPEPEEKDKKPEDEKKPTDPKTPEEEEPLDPKESEEPKTTEDPETPTDQGQPGQGVGQDQQETAHSTGNLSDNASENLPTAQDNQMNKDNRNLADSDKASANKKLLPQTGESLPFTPFLGLLLLIVAALLLFRKESIQNK